MFLGYKPTVCWQGAATGCLAKLLWGKAAWCLDRAEKCALHRAGWGQARPGDISSWSCSCTWLALCSILPWTCLSFKILKMPSCKPGWSWISINVPREVIKKLCNLWCSRHKYVMIGVSKKDHRMQQWVAFHKVTVARSLRRQLAYAQSCKATLGKQGGTKAMFSLFHTHIMITQPGTGEVVGAPGAGLGAGVSLSLALATFSQAMKRRKEVLRGPQGWSSNGVWHSSSVYMDMLSI